MMTNESNEDKESDALSGQNEPVVMCGFIGLGFLFDHYETIKLIQDNNLKVDLICRFNEIVDSFGSELSVRYWVTDKKVSLEDAKTGFIYTMMGSSCSSLEANEYSYSEYTSGIDYESDLTVGGHSLLRELGGEAGKYIWIEVTPCNT